MNYKTLVLNVMCGKDLEPALDRHAGLGLCDLDIKSGWSGSMIENTDCEQVNRIAAAASERQLSVYCLSSGIGNCRIDDSDARLAEEDAKLKRLLHAIAVLQARCARLILPRGDETVCNDERIVNRYRSWCEQINNAGARVVIENEIGGSIGRNPLLVDAFFKNLNAGNRVFYTWDIANQWQEGRYPSLADYRIVKPWIGMLHVKGGRWDNSRDQHYAWKAMLDESDWPVAELCHAAINDGVPAICINPPHGQTPDDWSYDLERDLTFVHQLQETAHA